MYETRENNARILSKFVLYKFYKQNTEKKGEQGRKKHEILQHLFTGERIRICTDLQVAARHSMGRFVGFSAGAPGRCWMDAAERQKNYVWREIKQ